MPRPLRRHIPGATYTTSSRCIAWSSLMIEEDVRRHFLEIVRQARNKYGFELTFYQVMPTHFHLIIRTPKGGATISRILQFIKSRFAEWFNKCNGRIGPFWNERFRSTIVNKQDDPSAYLLSLFWHLAHKPVRKGLANHIGDYPFNSMMDYLSSDHRGSISICPHELYLNIGDSVEERIIRFKQYDTTSSRK